MLSLTWRSSAAGCMLLISQALGSVQTPRVPIESAQAGVRILPQSLLPLFLVHCRLHPCTGQQFHLLPLPPLRLPPGSPRSPAAWALQGCALQPQICSAGKASSFPMLLEKIIIENLFFFNFFFKVKARIANTSWKHCFLSTGTYALRRVGSPGQKSNGKCKIRKPYHPGWAQQYSIASAVITMEKEQNAVRG